MLETLQAAGSSSSFSAELNSSLFPSFGQQPLQQRQKPQVSLGYLESWSGVPEFPELNNNSGSGTQDLWKRARGIGQGPTMIHLSCATVTTGSSTLVS